MQVLVKEALQLSARLRLSNSIPNHEVCHTARRGLARQPRHAFICSVGS